MLMNRTILKGIDSQFRAPSVVESISVFDSLPTAHLILRFEDGTSEDHFRPVDALKLNVC